MPQEGRVVWATARFISRSQNVSCIGDFSTDNAMPKVSTGTGGVDFFVDSWPVLGLRNVFGGTSVKNIKTFTDRVTFRVRTKVFGRVFTVFYY